MQVKAIQTVYKGYKFRSRLEARWAVFFDTLGVDWEYEVEGFELGDGVYYLPDFKVTTSDGAVVWYEIKPFNENHCDKFAKFKELLEGSASKINDAHAVMLCGDPVKRLVETDDEDFGMCPRCGIINTFAYGIYHSFEETHFGCMVCDYYTPGGRNDDLVPGLVCRSRSHKGANSVFSSEYKGVYLPKIAAAASKARSARFEHGESGASL